MILDTCALLFLSNGDKRLSTEARGRMAVAEARYFSAISGFEIGNKLRLGKLDLPYPPSEWLARLKTRYKLSDVPLDLQLCSAAAELPLHHRDPFDRFIIALAKRMRLPVVTTDPKFSLYGVEVVS